MIDPTCDGLHPNRRNLLRLVSDAKRIPRGFRLAAEVTGANLDQLQDVPHHPSYRRRERVGVGI